MDFWEIFRSVEIVWLTWFASLVTFGLVLRRTLLRLARLDFRAIWRRLHWRRIHRNQSGAAYSLAFILVFPFLVFLIALIIETSFMLTAKIGTMHAAFGAVRSGAVWSTGDLAGERERSADSVFTTTGREKAEQAAVTAMVPYASGTGKSGGYDIEAENYHWLYNTLKVDSASPKSGWGEELQAGYIMKKYRYAARHTKVELSLVDAETPYASRSAPWEQYVKAVVSYEYPFHILPVGRALLGSKQADGSRTYTITSTAVINNECPRNGTGRLGIRILP